MSHAMTRERLIEIYEAEIRQAFDDIGDDFDLCQDDIDFTDDGAVICGEVEILPPGTIDTEPLAGIPVRKKIP
jgi:hypothetical protein